MIQYTGSACTLLNCIMHCKYKKQGIMADADTEVLMDLMKNFINETESNKISPADWTEVFRLASANGVSGIVGYMIMRYSIPVSEQIYEKAVQNCTNTVGITVRRIRQTDRLIEELSRNGIDHLFTKGYEIRKTYPEQRLRTFGDIDMLIHKEDRKRCDELMQKLGYQLKKGWEPVYTYLRDTEYYEIHTSIMDTDIKENSNCIDYFDHAWDHAVRRGGSTFVLKPDYHLIYLIAHLAKHVSTNGAGIRMYMDIALYLKFYEKMINWEWFYDQMNLIEMKDFCEYVFSAIELWFDVKCPVHNITDPDTLEQMKQMTIYGGVFGKETVNIGASNLKSQVRKNGEFSKLKALRTAVFPSVEALENRYTYLKDKPWLLPAAWIHRIAVNSGKLKLEQQKVKEIIQTDIKEIERINELNRKIGL